MIVVSLAVVLGYFLVVAWVLGLVRNARVADERRRASLFEARGISAGTVAV